MLTKISNIILKHPWLVVAIIFLITIGFGIFIPSMEMQTTLEDFIPDDDVSKAQTRIDEYFGLGYEVLMVLIEPNDVDDILDPRSLREMNYVAKEINKFEETADTLSIPYLLDSVCFAEYGKGFENCKDGEIKKAYQDLMTDPTGIRLKMLDQDDENNEIDYISNTLRLKNSEINSIDIKNYYIEEKENQFCFSIEVHDLSNFESDSSPPHKNMNVMEWYIDFKNEIIPDERLNMSYKIAAHIEPTTSKWEIGKGFFNNIRVMIENLKDKTFFNSYKKEAYLWITLPGYDMAFPSKLKTGDIIFDNENNIIEITVDKEELGLYGIATVMGDYGLPTRLYNTKAGFRVYESPFLNRPWSRYTFNFSYLLNLMNKVQKRPMIGGLFENLISKSTGLTWQDFDQMFQTLEENDFSMNNISLKDLDFYWRTIDVAPNTGYSDNTYYIKPMFLEDIKKNVYTFLSPNYFESEKKGSALMMVQIYRDYEPNELTKISKEIVITIDELDEDYNLVSMRTTGMGVIEYEINEVAMDANSIVIPMIFVVISIILFFSFRRLSYIFLPLLGLSIAIIWLFGTMVILKMPFMIMQVALIPLLMGLGVDYSVHIYHNYRAEIKKGKSPGQAIAISIKDIGLAMFLATVTTFIAFLSFLTASMTPLRDFGVLCAIGIAYTFIITITLLAAFRYIIDRRKKQDKKKKTKKRVNGKFMKKIAKIICKRPKTILIITLVASLFMIFGALQIQTGFQMEDFLPSENQSVITMNDVSREFPFSSQEKEYILIEGNVASVATLKGISKSYNEIKNDKYVMIDVDGEPKVNTILGIIDKVVERNSSLIEKYNLDSNNIPQTDRDVEELFDFLYYNPIYEYDVKEVLHKNEDKYDATQIVIYTSMNHQDDLDINQALDNLYHDLKGDADVDFGETTVIVTGDNSFMYVIINSMTESQIISTGFCIILAAIVLIIAYRNPILGLIAMLPVSVSTIWIIGSMHFIGYSLNIMTIMITSLTIGLGITYAIHAVERFRLIADRTGNVIEAVSETIGHTGGALLIAAITTMAGFMMLYFTPVPVEQQFGLITALTILFAFLASILILPPVLLFWGRSRKRKKGYIISNKKPSDEIKN